MAEVSAPSPDADGLVGSVTIWPCETLPGPKYLFAEGQAVSRTVYSLLFSRYGTRHGTGDGSTTFNLPNYKGKFLVGFDETDTAYDTVGETGGAASGSVAAHTHTYSGTVAGQGSFAVQGGASGNVQSGTNLTFSGTTSSDGGGSVSTIPPYNVVRYIVKVS